ncbi:hypothetical protein [Leptolyngbya sp. FACHB-711]|uniref:hypothetical protein n=1 Tax=unclassified Leptolyngbya TaxID=2650499 RepID=UPI001687937F|nr:hypothetical protein [Leptolyngbya sp. FACHB-711]MBD1848528.1 hypothetical protein [Cyanobacteria bacterium FACHB-502]MBD2025063.1 hypothetical protein [Leptolyngbya sp. FACHB-711]
MQAVKATVVVNSDGYTRDELRLALYEHTSYRLEAKQFYPWLPYCLSRRKALYSERDLAKFVFVAQFIKRVRSLELARDALIEDIQQNPHKYPEEMLNVN